MLSKINSVWINTVFITVKCECFYAGGNCSDKHHAETNVLCANAAEVCF